MSSNHKKTLSLVIFLTMFTTISADSGESLRSRDLVDSLLSLLGESTPLSLYNKYIQTFLNEQTNKKMLSFGDEPASEKYSKLGKEVQVLTGIPEERHVPIKKLDQASPLLALSITALAEPDAIYVNEERLAQCSFGAQRSALFHEAIHEKYHDMAFNWLLEWSSLISTSLISYRLIKNINPLNGFLSSGIPHKSSAFVAGLITSYTLMSKFSYHIERRADIEGHYATACYKCVEESAAFAKYRIEVESHPLMHNGYLWPNELEKIALDLREEDKLCDHHSINI